MTIIETLEPLIIKPKDAIRCDLLCDLRCVYSKGNIEYDFDKNGQVHFNFKGKDSVDVYYNNIPYKLKHIYIGERRHKSFPDDPTIVGECTLYHVGKNNTLIISVLLRTTRGFSSSQDFFSQFLSKQIGTLHVNKKIVIDTANSWSPQLVLPSKTGYYIYDDELKKTKTIVFIKPVEIDSDDLAKAIRLQKPVVSERPKHVKEYLYFHPIESTVPNSNDKSEESCKPSDLFADSDPHKNCELKEGEQYNDSPSQYIGLEEEESILQATIVSIFLLLLAIGFFKGIPRLPFDSAKILLKFLGTLIWLPVHLCYIWFGQGSTIFLFFWVFVFGYLREKMKEASDKMKRPKKKKDDDQNPNQPINANQPPLINPQTNQMDSNNSSVAIVSNIPEAVPQPDTSSDSSTNEQSDNSTNEQPDNSTNEQSDNSTNEQSDNSTNEQSDKQPDEPSDNYRNSNFDPNNPLHAKIAKIFDHVTVWKTAYMQRKYPRTYYYRFFGLETDADLKTARAKWRDFQKALFPDRCKHAFNVSICTEYYKYAQETYKTLIEKYIGPNEAKKNAQNDSMSQSENTNTNNQQTEVPDQQSSTQPSQESETPLFLPDSPDPSSDEVQLLPIMPTPTPEHDRIPIGPDSIPTTPDTPTPDTPTPNEPTPDTPTPNEPTPDTPTPDTPTPNEPTPAPDRTPIGPDSIPTIPDGPPPLPPRPAPSPSPSPDEPTPPPLPPRPTPPYDLDDEDEIDDALEEDDIDKALERIQEGIDSNSNLLDHEIEASENAIREFENATRIPPPPPPINRIRRRFREGPPFTNEGGPMLGGVYINGGASNIPKIPKEVKKYYGHYDTGLKDQIDNFMQIDDEEEKIRAIKDVYKLYQEIIDEIRNFVKNNKNGVFIDYIQTTAFFGENLDEVVRDINAGTPHRLRQHENTFNKIKSEIYPDFKKSEEEIEERERTMLCEWLHEQTGIPIYDNKDAEDAFEMITNTRQINNIEEENTFQAMSKYFYKYKEKGKICIHKSEAWALFMTRISEGIYTNNHPEFRTICTTISVFALGLFFIFLFGSPIRFKKSKITAAKHSKYEDGENICRNRIRTLGNGYPIDTCYKPTDLVNYIIDDDSRKIFHDKYIQMREDERNAYDSSLIAFKAINPKLDMKANYKIEMLDKENNVTDIIEVKACDFFNDFFAQGTKRQCIKRTIRQPPPVEVTDQAVGFLKNAYVARQKSRKQKKKEKAKKKSKKMKKAFKPGKKCFAKNTKVLMENNKYKYIQDIVVGDILENNNKVNGIMKFSGLNSNLVNNSGIITTFGHHILHNNMFKMSGNVPGSKAVKGESNYYLYDIDTSNHRIIVLDDNNNRVIYTDFSEVDDESGKVYKFELDLLNSEQQRTPVLLY